MKKGLMSLLFVVIFSSILILSVNATAQLWSYNAPTCPPESVNQTRVAAFDNGCGSYVQVCAYFGPAPPRTATCWRSIAGCRYGYHWVTLLPQNAASYHYSLGSSSGSASGAICVSNSTATNPCCGSSCGYKPSGEFYSDCGFCTNGYLRNASNYASCHFNQGVCYVGTCYQNPSFVNSQSDINLSDRTQNLSVHFSFFDNVALQSYNIRLCSWKLISGAATADCLNETISISGTNFIEPWELPEDMKFWIDENAGSDSVFDVTINVSNFAGLNAESVNPFRILGEDLPRVKVSVSDSSLKFGQKFAVNAEVTERLSGIDAVKIFTDDALSESCSTSPCSYEYIPNEGEHTYKVTAQDKAGNFGTASGSFSVAIVEKTCSEIGGAVCGNDERCTNDQYTKTLDTERCCTSSCYSSELNLTCSAQSGIIFDPSVQDCPAEIPATDVISPNGCCAVQPTDKLPPLEETVYWTDSMGNRIFGTGLQESVRCKATGIIDHLQILKDGNVVLEKKDTSLALIANELGTYVCNANYTDGNEKDASLSVAEVPAPNSIVRARLPGFGFAQFLIALVLISAYYIIKRENERKN